MAIVPAIAAATSLPPSALTGAQPAAPVHGMNFGEMLARGLEATELKVGKADALIEAFAKGEAIPLHQVALALEEAKIAVTIATQVRTRLLEAYRDFMTMQL